MRTTSTARRSAPRSATGIATNWRMYMATDAVIDTRPGSPTMGKPVCRAVIDGRAGPDRRSGADRRLPAAERASVHRMRRKAALAYAFGDLTESDDIRNKSCPATFTGELWKGWGAGALKRRLRRRVAQG